MTSASTDNTDIDFSEQTALPGSMSELMPRVQALVDNDLGELASSVMKLPLSIYSDADLFDREVKAIHKKLPLFAGLSAQIPNTGDYFTRDMLGTPLILMRDESGAFKALVNSCRHRGAKLLDGHDCVKQITCPYHAWSYRLDGSLKSINGQNSFGEVQDNLDLVELPSEEKYGLLWVCLDPNATLNLDAHLEDMGAELASWDFGSVDYDSVVEIDYAANWKSVTEAFTESYHFHVVHGNSIVGQEIIANISSYDQMGAHHRLGLPMKYMRYPEQYAHQQGCSVSQFVFPNLVIANTRIGAEFIDILPSRVDQTRFRHTLALRTDIHYPDEYKKIFGEGIRVGITEEDPVIIESASAGLASAHNEFALIGRNEAGAQNLHRQIQRAL